MGEKGERTESRVAQGWSRGKEVGDPGLICELSLFRHVAIFFLKKSSLAGKGKQEKLSSLLPVPSIQLNPVNI